MGKILGIGLWVCIVTLGAVYGSIYLATAPAGPSDEDAKKAGRHRWRAGRAGFVGR